MSIKTLLFSALSFLLVGQMAFAQTKIQTPRQVLQSQLAEIADLNAQIENSEQISQYGGIALVLSTVGMALTLESAFKSALVRVTATPMLSQKQIREANLSILRFTAVAAVAAGSGAVLVIKASDIESAKKALKQKQAEMAATLAQLD
ncbi:MAG: hypothetical protein B7Y39_18800 [Bdellovibrio sp. 28-41-41]|nr:MAG: hypothetical protein B7Y39_18800 [Bdellovibrio sp. 28-41-41]